MEGIMKVGEVGKDDLAGDPKNEGIAGHLAIQIRQDAHNGVIECFKKMQEKLGSKHTDEKDVKAFEWIIEHFPNQEKFKEYSIYDQKYLVKLLKAAVNEDMEAKKQLKRILKGEYDVRD